MSFESEAVTSVEMYCSCCVLCGSKSKTNPKLLALERDDGMVGVSDVALFCGEPAIRG